jgi:predicted TIM-barrel fold metal-dependent hydrolase
MMSVLPSQLAAVETIAARHPDLRIAIDHMGRDMGKVDEAAFPNMDGLVALAKRNNVAVKATGLPAYTNDAYPYARMQGYLRRTFDAFGPKRVFWGSDLTKLPCSYRACVTMFTEDIDWLSADDLRSIMGAALCEWLGWTPGSR